MSALEDEGVRAILDRLDRLEAAVANLASYRDGLAAGNVVVRYYDDGAARPDVGPVLAGQAFSNELRAVRADLVELRNALPEENRPGFLRCMVNRREP